MIKNDPFIRFAGFAILLLAVSSCKEPLLDNPTGNLPPETTLFLDTTDVNTVISISEITLFWSGDDPDGEVAGYFYSVDSMATWQFTTERSVKVIVPTLGKDTIITRLFAAAADASGDGKYNSSVLYLGKNIGGEPFTDQNSDGLFSSGEPFTDIGLIDPTPAGFAIRIKNTPPVARFQDESDIPAVTLPVATFALDGTDADGVQTLNRAEIALNDTTGANWVSLPAKPGLVTLIADLSESGDTTEASIFLGSDLKPTGTKIKNLALNANNVLYYRLVDNTDAHSPIVSMPAKGSGKIWRVNASANAGQLLIIRAHELGDGDSLRSVLKRTPSDGVGGYYSNPDLVALQNPDLSQTISKGIRNTLIRATVFAYRKLIWYGMTDPAVNLAQSVIPSYLNAGGKAFVRFGFSGSENALDLEGLRFLPIDSVNQTYYFDNGTTRNGFASFFRSNRYIIRDPDTSPEDTTFFKSLPQRLGSQAFISQSFYTFVPSSQAYILYRLDAPQTLDTWPQSPSRYGGFGTPVVMIENLNRSLVFTTVPITFLTRIPTDETYPKTEGGKTYVNPATEILSKILSVEFERPSSRRRP